MTDYGDALVAPVAISKTGPLSRLGPGSLTHWMGVPSHADAIELPVRLSSGPSRMSFPAFWPARIPNGVLAEANYRIVMDTAGRWTSAARLSWRRDWERFISAANAPADPRRHGAGSVRARDDRRSSGPADGAFPAAIKVESGVGFDREPETLYPEARPSPTRTVPAGRLDSDDNSLRLVDADANVTVMQLSAPLERPQGLTRGLDGNIYVCCINGNVIRRVTPKGEVTLFARAASPQANITSDRSGNFTSPTTTRKGFVTAMPRWHEPHPGPTRGGAG